MNKPTNAYELCERVCEAIELAPQNYYQNNFSCSVAELMVEQAGEACGTAFCRAGWMCAIMDEKPTRSAREWESLNLYRPAKNFFLSAGIESNEIEDLFDGQSNIEYGVEYGDPDYTQQGIEGMKDFMERNKAKLLAHSTEKWVAPKPFAKERSGDGQTR